MTYAKQTWQDNNGAFPVSASRMLTIEQGVFDAHYKPYAICTRSTQPGGAPFPSAAYGALPFESVAYQTGMSAPWVVGSPTRLVVPVAGTYLISGAFVYSTNTGLGTRNIALRVNGTTLIQNEFPATAVGGAGFTASRQISSVYRLAAADYVELLGWQDSGASLNVVVSDVPPLFSFTLLAY